jgi:hypothetical protein
MEIKRLMIKVRDWITNGRRNLGRPKVRWKSTASWKTEWMQQDTKLKAEKKRKS